MILNSLKVTVSTYSPQMWHLSQQSPEKNWTRTKMGEKNVETMSFSLFLHHISYIPASFILWQNNFVSKLILMPSQIPIYDPCARLLSYCWYGRTHSRRL